MRDNVDTKSSQKKKELAYPSLPIEARISSNMKRTKAMDVKIVKLASAYIVVVSSFKSSPKSA